MSNILTRLWNILRGRTDRLIDELERPEDQLNLFVSDLSSQVQDLQRSVASAIADEKRLHKEIQALASQSDEWEARAVLALQDGNEPLARSALAKQEDCETQSAQLHEGWEAQKQATAQLKESLKLARTRMDEARRKYNLLIAQYKSAQTKKKIQDTLNSVSTDSPMAAMQALEEKIRRVESDAEAQLALSADMVDADLEAQFHRLEQKHRGQDRLAELKARLDETGRIPAETESESGSAGRIDELKRELDS